VSKEFPVEPVAGFGTLRKYSAKYDDVKQALKLLELEVFEDMKSVSWEGFLAQPARDVWEHDGKCSCGRRTYLFGQCPECIRNDAVERLIEGAERREATAEVEEVPEDGVPSSDLVAVATASRGQSLVTVCPQDVAESSNWKKGERSKVAGLPGVVTSLWTCRSSFPLRPQ
jgi:hypothetical protein